jgi:hypothetical protein
MLGKLVKLYIMHPPLVWNMIKFEHDTFQISYQKYVEKGIMVQTFQDGILKLNHLLSDEMFKKKARVN